MLVSGHYFTALGLTPALGRLLGPDDDRVPGAHPVVVLSHSYWTTRFGADPAVLDDTLVVNGEPMTIVGVAPEGFFGTTTMDRPQVFVPLTMAQQMFRDPKWNGLTARNNHWLYVFGRLQPGVSREQAEALLKVPFTTLIREVEFPALRSGMGDRDRQQFLQRQILLQDGARGRNSDRGKAQTMLLFMFAITGFVLAIACANVANLLLARVADRATEISVRLSIGASTGTVAAAASRRGVRARRARRCWRARRLAPDAERAPRDDAGRRRVDAGLRDQHDRAALHAGARAGNRSALRSVPGAARRARGNRRWHPRAVHRTSGSRSANRFRTSLATAQIALATALLAMAGLFVVSLVNLARSELGIRREGLVTFRLSPYLNGYSPERALALFERVEDELLAIPGVVAVTSSTVPVLANSDWNNNVTVEGFDAGPDANTSVSVTRTSSDYFRTLGIPMLAGREFTRTDDHGSAQGGHRQRGLRAQVQPRLAGHRKAAGDGSRRQSTARHRDRRARP